MKHSFEAYDKDRLVFFSDRHWLHPLVEFEEFVNSSGIDPGILTVHDKIVGKAAGLYLVCLGVRTVHSALLSELARDALKSNGVKVTFETLIPRIQCRTENMLLNVENAEEGYSLIRDLIMKNKT